MADCLSNKVRKTRKPCKCFGCLRTMPAGSMVRKCCVKDGNVLGTQNYCAVCDEATRDWGWDDWDNCGEGGIRTGDCPEQQAQWELIRERLEADK